MPRDEKNIDSKRHQDSTNRSKCVLKVIDENSYAPTKTENNPQTKCPITDVQARKLVSKCFPSIEYVKTSDLRGSVLYRCECIKRNGLQDRCMMWDCMGKPECLTKLYPTCLPGQAMLRKIAGLSDVKSALDKFLAAEQTRDFALAEYCRLVCPETKKDPVACPISLTSLRRPTQKLVGQRSPDQCTKLYEQQKIYQNPQSHQQPVLTQHDQQTKSYGLYPQLCPAYKPYSSGHDHIASTYQDKIYQQPVYQKQLHQQHQQQQPPVYSPQRQPTCPQYYLNSAGNYHQQEGYLYRPQEVYRPVNRQIICQSPHAQMQQQQQQYVPYMQNTFVQC